MSQHSHAHPASLSRCQVTCRGLGCSLVVTLSVRLSEIFHPNSTILKLIAPNILILLEYDLEQSEVQHPVTSNQPSWTSPYKMNLFSLIPAEENVQTPKHHSVCRLDTDDIGITVGLICPNYPIRLLLILEIKVTCPISFISTRLFY